MRRMLLILCVTLTIVPAAYATKIKTTEDLVQAMQKKYAKTWYTDRDLRPEDNQLRQRREADRGYLVRSDVRARQSAHRLCAG